MANKKKKLTFDIDAAKLRALKIRVMKESLRQIIGDSYFDLEKITLR